MLLVILFTEQNISGDKRAFGSNRSKSTSRIWNVEDKGMRVGIWATSITALEKSSMEELLFPDYTVVYVKKAFHWDRRQPEKWQNIHTGCKGVFIYLYIITCYNQLELQGTIHAFSHVETCSRVLRGNAIGCICLTHSARWTVRSVGEPGAKGTNPRPPKTGRMKESSNLRQ